MVLVKSRVCLSWENFRTAQLSGLILLSYLSKDMDISSKYQFVLRLGN